MPNIKQITLPTGTTYDIVDQGARDLIDQIQSYTDYLGVTTTALTDGATTNPITIGGKSVTAKKGNIANYGAKEFIWNGSAWQEFGDMSGLGALAYKDSATGSYKPEGSVSQPTFTGKSMTSTGKFTPAGDVTVSAKSTSNKTATVAPALSGEVTYTPGGTVGTPTITVTPNTAKIKGMATQGSLPSFTATVTDEVLSLGWDAGALPTQSSEQTFVTGIESATSTQPSFTGTGVRLVTGNIPVPSAYTASFTGTEGDVSVTGTTDGTVGTPTFTGTSKTVTVS